MDEYSIDQILDELKEQRKRCNDFALRIVKARLDHDKEAEMKTWIDMEAEIVRNTQEFSFLIDYLSDLKAKGLV